MEKEHKHTK